MWFLRSLNLFFHALRGYRQINIYIYDFIEKDTEALEIPLKKKDYKKIYFHCCV